MFTRRHFLKTWAALPVALQSQHVLARQLSDKPIRLLVAASSGTTVDTVARFLAPPLAGLVGAPVVVENRPGAGLPLGYRRSATKRWPRASTSTRDGRADAWADSCCR